MIKCPDVMFLAQIQCVAGYAHRCAAILSAPVSSDNYPDDQNLLWHRYAAHSAGNNVVPDQLYIPAVLFCSQLRM